MRCSEEGCDRLSWMLTSYLVANAIILPGTAQIATGTGLYNLMRNVGGSTGIAVITTMFARDAQPHQASVVSHLTPFDYEFSQSVMRLLEIFLLQTDSVTATASSIKRPSSKPLRTYWRAARLLSEGRKEKRQLTVYPSAE